MRHTKKQILKIYEGVYHIAKFKLARVLIRMQCFSTIACTLNVRGDCGI